MIKQKKPNKSYTSLDVGPLPQVGQTVNSNPLGSRQVTSNILSDYAEIKALTKTE